MHVQVRNSFLLSIQELRDVLLNIYNVLKFALWSDAFRASIIIVRRQPPKRRWVTHNKFQYRHWIVSNASLLPRFAIVQRMETASEMAIDYCQRRAKANKLLESIIRNRFSDHRDVQFYLLKRSLHVTVRHERTKSILVWYLQSGTK